MIRKAVFPVAGLGTRMLPATKAIPKEMLPVVDKPIIQYAFEEARAAGIEQFIFVTGRGKSVIEDHFDRAYELDDALAQEGQAGRAGGGVRLAAGAGRAQLHPPAGGARARPRGVVRAPPGRQRAVRGDPGRRPDPGRRALPAADGRGARRDRRQHRRGRGGAAASTPTATACSTRQRRRPAGRGQGPGREARSGRGALAPRGHRPLHPAARGVRASVDASRRARAARSS